MKTSLLVALIIFWSCSSQASLIAIIDSGTDMKHDAIKESAWNNSVDIPMNDRDEDFNGYQDDFYGWNFAESNSQVIDYNYLGTLNDKIRRFFDIQTTILMGTASRGDVDWARGQLKDPAFIKRISIYGNFMHGTHVAGIALKQSPESQILAAKIIPTEAKLPGQKLNSEKGLGTFLLKKGLGVLAGQQMKLMAEVAAYIDGHKALIANGSFGTGYPQSKKIVETLAKTFLRRELTKEESHEVTLHFLETLLKKGHKMVEAAPNTLFVFAAGNDGLNNDQFPVSPTNIDAPNVISVAATAGMRGLAPFSNYGLKVHVAAPGVGIQSTVPGNEYLAVSGTSQAAPYVAGVAASIRDLNDQLTPAEVKALLIKTVDHRDDLNGKILSGGIINADRAKEAARLSRQMTLEQAIEVAKNDIADRPQIGYKSNHELVNMPGMVLPLPNPFR